MTARRSSCAAGSALIASGRPATPCNIHNAAHYPKVFAGDCLYFRIRTGPRDGARIYWHADLGACLMSAAAASRYGSSHAADSAAVTVGASRQPRRVRVTVVPCSTKPCVVEVYWRVRVGHGWWNKHVAVVNGRCMASGEADRAIAVDLLHQAQAFAAKAPGTATPRLVRVRVLGGRPEPGTCPHCGALSPHARHFNPQVYLRPFFVCRRCHRSFDEVT
jgi:hypothetical protein